MADDQPPTPQDPAPAAPPPPEDADPRDLAADIAAHMDPSTIDELLRQASFDDPATAMAARSAPSAREAAPTDGAAYGSAYGSATASASAPAAAPELPPGAGAMDLPNFGQVMRDAQVSSIDLLRDVDLNVKIELGRSRMLVEDVLKLGEGSVVELDKLAGDPVDVFVNERLVARGEVLVLNDNFCVRINEIVSGVRDEGL